LIIALLPFVLRAENVGKVTAVVHQDEVGRVTALELRESTSGGRRIGHVVARTDVDRSSTVIKTTFTGIAPGEYVFIARGTSASEQLIEPVQVVAGAESKLSVQVQPIVATIVVRDGGEPLTNARLRVDGRDLEWSAKLTTDGRGKAELMTWQSGRARVTVAAPPRISAPYSETFELEGTKAEWTIEIPRREIKGVVIDAGTGVPVKNAAVVLAVRAQEWTFSAQTKTDASGRYRFYPAAYGEHTVKAAARGYPPGEVSYSFAAPDESREVTLALEAAEMIQVKVLNSGGRPIAEADLLHFRGFSQQGVSSTDASGSAVVPISAREPRDVYVVPRAGSFGFAQFASRESVKPIRISDGDARIVLRMRSAAGAPVANVAFVMRYNGRTVPADVVRAMARVQGVAIMSDKEGRLVLEKMPLGFYEFWPVDSPTALHVIATSPDAPVRFMAMRGENTAELTFTEADE
jgi:hypothetical protein